jgi:hypothetical protein
MGGIPESDRVEESFGIRAGELELPVLARVGGVVDAGLVTGPGGQEEGFVSGEGDDAAEIQSRSVRDLGRDPGSSGVGGANVGAVGAGSPGELLRDSADAAKIFRGVRGLSLAGNLGEGSRGDEKNEQRSHAGDCLRKGTNVNRNVFRTLNPRQRSGISATSR